MTNPNQFTVKASSGDTLLKLRTHSNVDAVTVVLKDGKITLNSREYLRSEFESRIVAEGIKKGDELDITFDLTPRYLLTLTVNGQVTAVQLNWASYRGEVVEFHKLKQKQAKEEAFDIPAE